MPRPKSPPTSPDWATLLQQRIAQTTRTPPGKGWERFEEIWDKNPIGRVRLQRLLAAAVRDGQVETFSGNRMNSSGKLTCTVWYRQVKRP